MKTIPLLALLIVPGISLVSGQEITALDETVIQMSVPSNNKLPWGFVEGKVASPIHDSPVIIQIYKAGEPVHFAQVQVNDDGTYQYRFRVLDVTNGQETRIFDGDYTVKIFKTVILNSSYLDSLESQVKSGQFKIDLDVLGF